MKTVNAKKVMKALKILGFEEARTKGDHYVFKKDGFSTQVPYHGGKVVPKGTLNLICRNAGITKKQLLEVL